MAYTVDQGSEEIVHGGANMSQLAKLFGVPRQTVTAKLINVTPDGTRRGVPVFHVRHVAHLLVKPTIGPDQLTEAIKGMTPNDLPMALRKEFWQAQKLEQAFKVQARDLWHTSEVVEKVGELLKLVKMSAQLMSDTVERNTELTERQRLAIRQLTNAMLVNLQAKAVEHFDREPVFDEPTAPKPSDDDGL